MVTPYYTTMNGLQFNVFVRLFNFIAIYRQKHYLLYSQILKMVNLFIQMVILLILNLNFLEFV